MPYHGKKGGFVILAEGPLTELSESVVDEAQFEREKQQTARRISNLFESIIGKSPQEFEKTPSGRYKWAEGKETLEWWCDTEEQYADAYELLELSKNIGQVTTVDDLQAVETRLEEYAARLEVIEDDLEGLLCINRELLFFDVAFTYACWNLGVHV